jgi:PPM family protein phosphatase
MESHHEIRAFFFTNTGTSRTNNEDSLLLSHQVISEVSMEKPEERLFSGPDLLFCVADGIGGAHKGEVASNLVLSFFSDHQDEIRDIPTLQEICYQAKKELDRYVATDPSALQMGCTISGVVIRGEDLILFTLGDCRIYRIHGGFFEKISREHSIVQNLCDEGLISEDEMRHHPKKHVITSALTGDGIDGPLEISAATVHIRKNDGFFICSDGIWECFSHDELEMIYQRFPDAEFCGRLLPAALARRAHDNISGILIRLVS